MERSVRNRWRVVVLSILVPVVCCLGLAAFLYWFERVEVTYATKEEARRDGFWPLLDACVPDGAMDVRVVWNIDGGGPSIRFTPLQVDLERLPGTPLRPEQRTTFEVLRPPLTSWWDPRLQRGAQIGELEAAGMRLFRCDALLGAAVPEEFLVYLWPDPRR